MDDIKSLSNKQVLRGIEDIVKEKFGWTHAYLMKDGKISGVIFGTSKTVAMFETIKKGDVVQ